MDPAARRLLVRLLAVGSFVSGAWLGLLGLAILAVPFRPAQAYMAALPAKHARLRTTPGPRIVFVGGSALAFGLDSQEVENRTGLAVLNLGMHAGIGLPVMLRMAGEYLLPGDTIVLSPEYELFFENATHNSLPEAVHADPSIWRFLRIRNDWTSLVKHGPYEMKRSVVAAAAHLQCIPPYCSTGFAASGDMIGHLLLPTPKRRAAQPDPWEAVDLDGYVIDSAVMDDVEAFLETARSRGASVAMSYPPLARAHFDRNRQRITAVDSALASLGLRAHLRPEAYAFDDEFFFDTEYHLGTAGRRIRTQQVLAELRSAGVAVRQ
jgi:hypothetical protein